MKTIVVMSRFFPFWDIFQVFMYINLGLPPTYIATAEHDPLRDDGMLYAKRLEDAGVGVTLNNYMDGFHGTLAFFQHPIKMDVGIRMIDDLILYLDKNL